MKIPEIKKDLKRKSVTAVTVALDTAFSQYEQLIGMFYASYGPSKYIRTYAYQSSIAKGAVVATGSGAVGFIEANAPGYSTGTWPSGKIYDYNMAGGYGGSVPVWELMSAWAEGNIKAIIVANFR